MADDKVTFKVGDRVETLEDINQSGELIRVGWKGTILNLHIDQWIGVEWDDLTTGNELATEGNSRPCKASHGWWIHMDHFEYIKVISSFFSLHLTSITKRYLKVDQNF